MPTIHYLRTGRKLRATGTVLDRGENGMLKVKPTRDSWGSVWLTAAEIEAGKGKAPQTPRKAAEAKPKREKKPKPAPVPRWRQLVQEVRTMEIDHQPEGRPRVTMKFLTELANELEASQSLFQSKP
jgi:hypothetical protein